MAKRVLGPAALRVGRAVAAHLPAQGAVIGCSGGADSLALALGAAWAAARAGSEVSAVVVDHGLRPESAEVSDRVAAQLRGRGLAADVVRVHVDRDHPDGLEAAARHARLAALEATGRPVLLGHTLDDQAETVLLGLLRGSGTRSMAGMAAVRGPFIRPLLMLRRTDTEAACGEWGIEPWHDPMNDDERYARVRTRRLLPLLNAVLERDVAPALARTARLARADADHLDELALAAVPERDWLEVADLEPLPDALLWRVVRRWLAARSPSSGMEHVVAVVRLIENWHGQGPVAVPGAVVRRRGGRLGVEPRESGR